MIMHLMLSSTRLMCLLIGNSYLLIGNSYCLSGGIVVIVT